MEVFYPKGSINISAASIGGIALHATGPTDLSMGTEVTFAYAAYFPAGFLFGRGGVMPGLCALLSKSCYSFLGSLTFEVIRRRNSRRRLQDVL